jgi:phosphoserine phosphatase
VSSIANILPLSLEQYLDNNSIGAQLPIAFCLSESTLEHEQSSIAKNFEQGTAELVVFQTLTLKELLGLQNQAQLNIVELTTINCRNNQTSCRFNVSYDNFITARKAVAKYALENGIEAALLTQVPTLSEPGLLVMDMDSTTIEIECIDEIAKLAGVGEEVAEVTERAMQGELDFAQSLHQRVATLADSPESILSDVAKKYSFNGWFRKLNYRT